MVELADIAGPEDLRVLSRAELDDLAAQIRNFLIEKVSRTGGHLGPNLGVVELTLAVHRVFDSPRDQIVFDTGHQSYVHKLVTGRHDFSSLRRQGGISGYPSRRESEHDIVENSHASTALSWADGLAKANCLTGRREQYVVAVVGDGALTGGMAWEAINNIAAGRDRNLVILVNDNERSYAPTIGGLAERLATLRTTQSYERALDITRSILQRGGPPGRFAYEALHGVKKGLKDFLSPQGLFEDLGLKYIGPLDGHDIDAMEHGLRRARSFGGPVIVHAITEKGHGYPPAEQDEADRFHGIPVIDPITGVPLGVPGQTWTSVFAEEMLAIADERPDVVGITAAMLIPVGLERFAERYPDRVIDVGIAEQHAVTSAAGMAHGGLHPVVALYATFINRAFDQVLMDVGLHREPVTFVLDRAGLTGEDGASHNGMWDLSLLALVPGIRIAAPRDGARLRALLREAVAVDDGPTVVRYQKGTVVPDIPAIGRAGGMDVIAQQGEDDVLVLAVGAMAELGVELAQLLADRGIGARVLDPRWVLPLDAELAVLAQMHRLVVVLEDNGVNGGVATQVSTALQDAGIGVPVRGFGVPQRFLDHASRSQLLAQLGLTAQEMTGRIAAQMAELDSGLIVLAAEGRVRPG